MKKTMGMIEVEEVIEHEDGTATVRMNVPDDTKEFIMQQQGWAEWSDEEFQKLAYEMLKKAADEIEKEEK